MTETPPWASASNRAIPRWLNGWWWLVAPLSLYAAIDLLVQRTFLTWRLGGVSVGFDLAHMAGGLFVFASAFLMVLWLLVVLLWGLRSGISPFAVGMRVRTTLAMSVAVMLFIPYGPWEYVTFRLAGPGPSEGQQLLSAVDHCNRTLVALLLDQGVNVNAQPDGFSGPLHGAASNCGATMVRILIERGAAIDARNTLGYTPLTGAVRWGRPEVVSALLAAGADPRALTNDGESIQAFATERGDREILNAITRALGK